MKKLLGFLLFFAFAGNLFAQLGTQVQVPTSLPGGPWKGLTSAAGNAQVCVDGLKGSPFDDHTFQFQTNNSPSAVLITITGSHGGAYSSVTTSTTTAGAKIHFTGTYNGLCLTVTTLTGGGATVDAGYLGQLAGNAAGTVNLQDGSGNAITSTSNALDVNIKSGGATGLAQGSTTSGQLGTLTMAAVTTANPSYTTAQSSPLSLDVSGNLRTSIPADTYTDAPPSYANNDPVSHLTYAPNGQLIVYLNSTPGNTLDGLITTPMTGTTSTAVTGMGAQGGSFRVYVTDCTVSNSHATVGTNVLLQDGSGGATIGVMPAAPAYGGTAKALITPVRTSANTALYAKDETTGASVELWCTGFKGL